MWCWWVWVEAGGNIGYYWKVTSYGDIKERCLKPGTGRSRQHKIFHLFYAGPQMPFVRLSAIKDLRGRENIFQSLPGS